MSHIPIKKKKEAKDNSKLDKSILSIKSRLSEKDIHLVQFVYSLLIDEIKGLRNDLKICLRKF